MNKQFNQGTQFLSEHGLNLMAIFNCVNLTYNIQKSIKRYTKISLNDYKSLVLLGNGGSLFWEKMQNSGFQSDNPFDDFSISLLERTISEYWNLENYKILYPDNQLIPLMKIGELAGWHHPSPMGIGIHPTYGLWFAYRIAFVTTADLVKQREDSKEHHCMNCSSKPCIDACPAKALIEDGPMDTQKCISYCVTEGTLCNSKCLSRVSCLIASDKRYTDEQLHYHYSRALKIFKLLTSNNQN